jgi:iron(III) transport system substrate-binding protein
VPVSRRSALIAGSLVALDRIGSSHRAAATPSPEPVGGSLTVYFGRNEVRVRPLLDAIGTALDIDIQVRYSGTTELAATILEEGDKSPADVFFVQDGGALGVLADAGVLARLPDEILNKVEPRFRSRTGLWVGTSARARVLAYNTDNVTPESLPESVDGLVAPLWNARIGWTPSHTNFQTFVTAFRLLRGEAATRDWLVAMRDNGTVSFDGHDQVVQAVLTGELDAGLVNHYYKHEIKVERGGDAPLENHYFSNGDVGSLVNIAGAAILTSASNRPQAEAFIHYLLTPTAQAYFAEKLIEYPLIPEIQVQSDLLPLDEIEAPDIDLDDLSGLRETVTLLTDLGLL